MFDYLSEHPTTATILAAVHEVKPKLRRLKRHKVDEREFEASLQETLAMAPDLGNPERAPEDFLSNVGWATDMMKKMKIN